jgi:hypothetical protein
MLTIGTHSPRMDERIRCRGRLWFFAGFSDLLLLDFFLFSQSLVILPATDFSRVFR